MLSKCANPACSAAFRYLHEGRIFSLAVPAKRPRMDSPWETAGSPRVERYWLCPRCSQQMTLRWSNGAVVVSVLPAAA